MLTPQHSMVLLVALNARAHFAVAPLLDTPVTTVHRSSTAINITDVLTFFYHAGVVMLGLQRPLDALSYFSQCVAVPGRVESAIALAAFRKYTLASLAHFGKVRAQAAGRLRVKLG
jgi:hypothetical protein